MAAGGINAQFGFVDEVTPGTAVVVSRFAEFDSESLKHDKARVEHSALRTTRRTLGVNNYRVGRESVQGDVQLVLQNKGMALLTKHMMGAIATTTPATGTLSRSHKATVGNLDGKSMSMQIGMNDDTGTSRPKTFAGCKIPKWEISGKENDFAMLKLTVDGISGTMGTALATASYPVTPKDYFATQTVVKIGGAEVDCSEWSLSGDNGLDLERYYIRSTTPGQKKEQLEGAALRSYSGKLTLAFPDLAAYNRFLNDTTSSLQITMTGDIIELALAYSFDILCDTVRWDGETPTVDGIGRIAVDMSYTVVDALVTDGPVVLTSQNTDVAP